MIILEYLFCFLWNFLIWTSNVQEKYYKIRKIKYKKDCNGFVYKVKEKK